MFNHAMPVNQHFVCAWGIYKLTDCYSGRANDAMESLRNACCLSPHDSLSCQKWTVARIADFVARWHVQAVAWRYKPRWANPRLSARHRTLAASLAHSNGIGEISKAVTNCLSTRRAFARGSLFPGACCAPRGMASLSPRASHRRIPGVSLRFQLRRG